MRTHDTHRRPAADHIGMTLSATRREPQRALGERPRPAGAIRGALRSFLAGAIAAASLAAIPTAASASLGYLREDGIVFDSDVGAACGALHTDILFEPWGTSVDALDEPVLDFIAECMKSGALAEARVAVIGLGDASFLQPTGRALAEDRMNAVRDALLARGVDPRQIEPWALAVAWEAGERKPDRVVFRVLEGGPSWILR